MNSMIESPERAFDLRQHQMTPPAVIPLDKALAIAGDLLYRAKFPTQAEVDGVIRCLEAFDDATAVATIEELRELKLAVVKGGVGK